MSTAALVSVDEYLATTYRPDREFVEGMLIERNLGQNDHSSTHGEIFAWFYNRQRELRLKAFPEQRLRVSASRYRVPDICVVRLPWRREQVITEPPYICIEVLSPDDSLAGVRAKFDDILAMGVPNNWLLHPESRRAWSISREGYPEAIDGVLHSSDGAVGHADRRIVPGERSYSSVIGSVGQRRANRVLCAALSSPLPPEQYSHR